MGQLQTHTANSPAFSGWLDVSVPIYAGMVHFPRNPSIKIEVETLSHVGRGDTATISMLRMGSHTGTHVDAPIHFLPGGSGADKVPLANLIGPARVIEIQGRDAIKGGELRSQRLGRGERVLFKTSNSERCWNSPQFVPDFVSIAEDAASYLAGLNTLAIGVDYLSVGSPETHRTLLRAGVVIIEGLNLAGVTPGRYELVCLPLKILGCDGAPARALLRFTGSAHEDGTETSRMNDTEGNHEGGKYGT